MSSANEERYKAAMANAVKTIKSQKEHIADLEAKLAATEDRIEELEGALEEHGLPVPGKRKRDDYEDEANGKMDVDGAGNGGGKKAKASKKLPTVCQFEFVAHVLSCFPLGRY